MALFVRRFAPPKLTNSPAGDFNPNYHPSPQLMTIMEPYNYPAPPNSGEEDANVPPLSYDSTTYPVSYQKQPSGNFGETQDASLGYSSNPLHHGDPNHVLKRSFSTPSVGMPSGSSEQHSATGPSGEKKRNKLGYHRTSIACSHCRRRKIRCIASLEFPNRCTNCIRLKKECSFFPVEQQPAGDCRLPSQSNMGGSNVPTASPSPAILDQQPFPPMPATPMPNMGSPTPQGHGSEYFPSDPKGPPVALPADLSYGIREPAVGWMMANAGSNPISKSRDQHMAWRAYPVESPVSGQFPPYLHPSAGGSTSWTTSDAEPSNEALGWDSMPSIERSTSYSGEVLGTQPIPQYYQVGQAQSGDRQPVPFAASEMYSPSAVDVSMGSVNVGTGQPMNLAAGSLVAGVVQSSNPLSWQQTQQLMSQQQSQQQPQQQSQQQSQHEGPFTGRRGDYGMWGYDDDDGSYEM